MFFVLNTKDRVSPKSLLQALKIFPNVVTLPLLYAEHLFGDTYQELTEFGKETGAKIIEYTTDAGEHGVSILDVQRYNDELHAQSYHLHSKNGVVLRTQSIFEIKTETSD
jgi:hypothetical protein